MTNAINGSLLNLREHCLLLRTGTLNDLPFEVSSWKHWARLQHCCWAWLSNFCHCFSNPLRTFSSKMESLCKRRKV